MDRNATKDRQPFGALGPQARELTEAELDCVSGGTTTGHASGRRSHDVIRVSIPVGM
jgi:hypothetical protein